MGVQQPDGTTIYCNNHSAIQIAHNDVFHEHSKHIEIDCHFTQQHLVSDAVHFSFVSSHDQTTDVFTKATLPR